LDATSQARACAGCGAEFQAHRRATRRQKFCGAACQKQTWQREKASPTRVGTTGCCAVCQESFGVRHVAQRYCSIPCKAAAARAKVPQRWRHASSRYGVTPADFDRMLSEQGGCCDICRVDLHGVGLDRDAPQVDHDHSTGRVRAILCRLCNTALGNFRDDPRLVRAAAAYLECHRAA